VWPVITWLLAWGLRRHGDESLAQQLRLTSLRQLAHEDFAEYYDPFSGFALGSRNQSWTAAVALDWLSER
jgi:glycogen debranching enzyme